MEHKGTNCAYSFCEFINPVRDYYFFDASTKLIYFNFKYDDRM